MKSLADKGPRRDFSGRKEIAIRVRTVHTRFFALIRSVSQVPSNATLAAQSYRIASMLPMARHRAAL
jgi:hypothetical protein